MLTIPSALQAKLATGRDSESPAGRDQGVSGLSRRPRFEPQPLLQGFRGIGPAAAGCGGAGDTTNDSQAFQPSGRFCAANSL